MFQGQSGASDAGFVSAIYYAAGRTRNGLGTWNAADVINCSWGGNVPNTALTVAFTWATTTAKAGRGVPAIVAAGNNFSSSVAYPAQLSGTLSGLVAVGATTDQDVRSSYSQYGPQLDIVAPSSGGVFGIVTTDRVGNQGYDFTDATANGQFGGTSASAPLAAGVAALSLSMNPNLTAAQIKGLLRNTTDYVGGVSYDSATGFHLQFGYGRLNAHTAVRAVDFARAQLLVNGSTVVPDESGSVTFANVGQSMQFRVRNQGTQTLNLGALTLGAGPFVIGSGFGATLLPAGSSTTFTITFSPQSGGNFAVPLEFSTNDPAVGNYRITLNGSAAGASHPVVSTFRMDDGTIQRSRIRSLAVTFDSIVTFVVGASSAFSLSRAGGGVVGLNVQTATVNNATVATLTFSDSVQFQSLIDGRYSFRVNSAAVMGMLSDFTSAFHRYFGDANGDATVDGPDFSAFSSTYGLTSANGGFLTHFDVNGDGAMDGFDFSQFSARVFTTLP